MFVLVEELECPNYPENFQEVDVKDEPFEYDNAVSFNITLMLFFIYFYL